LPLVYSNTNLCPAGIATQKPELRKKLDIDAAAQRMASFFEATVELMQVMARARGHNHLNQFNKDDLASWDKDPAELAGIEWSGIKADR
jgi:glutamate synthase domain-containing protein 2